MRNDNPVVAHGYAVQPGRWPGRARHAEPLRLVLSIAAVLVLAPLVRSADSALDRGIARFVEEDYKAAQSIFEDAVEAAPDNPDYLLWLGRTYGRRAERSTGFRALGAFSLARKCKQSFEQAIEINPKHLASLQSLFDYYINAPGIVGGGDDKGEALIPKMQAVNPATAHRARASLHEKREQYAEAEAALRKAAALEPGEVGHRLSLASFLARRGRHAESDKLFANALTEQPDSPEVWHSRAKALIRSGRKAAEAKRLLERYLKSPLHAPDAEPYSNTRKLLEEL